MRSSCTRRAISAYELPRTSRQTSRVITLQTKPSDSLRTPENHITEMENFSEIYTSLYPRLLRFASDFTDCREDAENLLHDAFLTLWKINDHISEIRNINAYMFRLVRNNCLDYLKHRVHERNYAEAAVNDYNSRVDALSVMGDTDFMACELGGIIRKAIEALPQRCRQIFLMSRQDGLTYGQIAQQLGLSENTVCVQMGIALKRLRAATDRYLA